MKLTTSTVEVPMRSPFVAAHGELEVRALMLVELTDAGGLVGYGEAAPLRSYDGVGMADVRAALEDCRSELAAGALGDVLDPAARAALLARCERRAVLPQAVAAIDLALWDLAGRARRQPVWRLLVESAGADSTARAAPRIAVNWTIGSPDRSGAAREAQFAYDAGFRTVKLKVGIGDDAGRVAAVRAVAGGLPMAIRLDANGAWSSDEALRWLRVLAPAGIELCEEPVAGAEAIERLMPEVPVPLAIDESGLEPVALARRCAAAICLKVTRCGGITATIAAARRARELGYEVILTSTFDGPLGIASALHAAAVIEPDRACGLATLGLFRGRHNPLPAAGGTIAAPAGPGLGVGLANWY